MAAIGYVLLALGALVPAAAFGEYLQDPDHYALVCRRLKPGLTRLRGFLRGRNWEKWALLTLAGSLALVVLLTLAARWGLPGDQETDVGIYEALRVAFSVFEGDSADFRGHIADSAMMGWVWPIPWILTLLAWVLPLLVPVSALGTVLTLLWNHLPHHVPVFSRTWYLFSELEPNSIRMAKSIHKELEKTGDTGVFLFLRTQRGQQEPDTLEELKGLNYHLYPKNETQFLRLPWRRGRIVRFFFLSENTDENFNRMQDFLEAVKDRNLFAPGFEVLPEGQFRQELYLLSETESAQMLIDHLRSKLRAADGGREPVFRDTELHLLDRFRAVSYDLLMRQPLYGSCPKGKLHVLVLGFGRIGREFFRAACSMGVLYGCDTQFTLCDLEMERKGRAFFAGCPELEQSVRFRTRTLDAETDDLEELLRGREFHYILVALGDDERNIRVASRLKVHYRRLHWDRIARGGAGEDLQPQICVNIEDPVKHSYTEGLWQKKFDTDRDLRVFGGLDSAFSQEVLMPRRLWNAARQIHRCLSKTPASGELTWCEYERRSSMACAAHAAYHVASVGEDYQAVLAQWKQEILADGRSRFEHLVDAEHRRWMAYVRSEGMQRAEPERMEAYFGEIGSHLDILGKLTPCLVEDAEALSQIWERLAQGSPNRYRGKYSFRERDTLVVRQAYEIAADAAPEASENRNTINLQ